MIARTGLGHPAIVIAVLLQAVFVHHSLLVVRAVGALQVQLMPLGAGLVAQGHQRLVAIPLQLPRAIHLTQAAVGVGTVAVQLQALHVHQLLGHKIVRKEHMLVDQADEGRVHIGDVHRELPGHVVVGDHAHAHHIAEIVLLIRVPGQRRGRQQQRRQQAHDSHQILHSPSSSPSRMPSSTSSRSISR